MCCTTFFLTHTFSSRGRCVRTTLPPRKFRLHRFRFGRWQRATDRLARGEQLAIAILGGCCDASIRPAAVLGRVCGCCCGAGTRGWYRIESDVLLIGVSFGPATAIIITQELCPFVPQLFELLVDLLHRLLTTHDQDRARSAHWQPRLLVCGALGATGLRGLQRCAADSCRRGCWPHLRQLLRQIFDRGFELRVLDWVAATFAAVVLRMQNVQHRRRCLSLVQL